MASHAFTPTHRRRGRRALRMSVVTVALSCFLPASARAADRKSECLDAHAGGQELRLSDHWREAQQRFRSCASDTCPRPIAEDCARWSEEVRASLPSVIVEAKDPAGVDTFDAALVIDGVRVADRLPATSIEVDPGEHVVRCEHPGWTPVELRVALRNGEKDKRLGVRFTSPSAGEPTGPSSRRSIVPGVLTTGLGTIALGLGVTFAVLGKNKEDELAARPCGVTGTCAPREVDVVRRDYWIAGIASGVGAIAIAFGVWQLVTRSSGTRNVALVADGLRASF